MTAQTSLGIEVPQEQQLLQAKCFHPTGNFIEWKIGEVEQSSSNRFEQQVNLYPNRLAVKTNTEKFTYDQLNRYANRIAYSILSYKGAGEGPIALLLEHKSPMIAAIFGTLKAGKIFVSMDRWYPRERLSYMLKDSESQIIITDSENLPMAHELARSVKIDRLINVEELDQNLSSENLGQSVSPDSLAYIVYTSGSTGWPKGTMFSHRFLLHNQLTNSNAYHVSADDRLTLLHSSAFAAGLADIFSALLNGAALYPWDVKEEGLTHLRQWLAEEEITIMNWLPTAFRQFVVTLSEEDLPNLRLVVLGSEPSTIRDVELYRKHFSRDCLFVNRLGSTEAGNFCRYYIDKSTDIDETVVPAGYLAPGKDAYLTNDAGDPLGSGEVGEINVKSRFLSLGYWRKPELTNKAFSVDPINPEKRIYRSGDLGRIDSKGCITFLGRKDFQVKISGYRVEILEIEHALLEQDTVQNAVVVAREDRSGNLRLVAYWVSNPSETITLNELRNAVAEKLPDYMIPSAFMKLNALPETPTGKVDRRALPSPDFARPELDNPYIAPRTPLEESLVVIWAEVLGLGQVGIHDNFLELGGHSLLAMQIVSRVLDTTQVELPLQTLLQASTAASMAVVITQSQAEKIAPEEMVQMLAELESLSDEEAKRLIGDELRALGKQPMDLYSNGSNS